MPNELTGNRAKDLLYRQTKAQREDFLQQVTNYCMLGASDNELATFFNTDRDTWLYWMKHSEELRDAVNEGIDMADAKVAVALHKRATGYEYHRQKLVVNNKTGHAQIHDLVEHVPPDTTAGKFWLTNRRPAHWSDKQSIDHSGAVEIDNEITIRFVDQAPPLLNITPIPSNDSDET